VTRLLVDEAEPCDLLLEFVRDDDPEVLTQDAGTLRALVAARTGDTASGGDGDEPVSATRPETLVRKPFRTSKGPSR